MGFPEARVRRLREAEAVNIEEPTPRPFGASGREAIELCREWMLFLGAKDTVASAGEARVDCDLYSGRYVAWVWDARENLDVKPVERAATVAAHDGRVALVFVPGGVRPIARERADALGVALFRFGAYDSALDGANSLGRQLCLTGLSLA